MTEKNRKGRLFGMIAIGLVALSIYGLLSWFFPSEPFVRVATVPAIALGLWFAYLLCRPGILDPERLRRQKVGKPFFCVGLAIFVPVSSWTAVVVGVPALITRGLAPNTEELAVISAKREGGSRRTCDYKLGLVGYETMFKDTFCVSERLWNAVSAGEQVVVLMRKDIFGTRIFEIKEVES